MAQPEHLVYLDEMEKQFLTEFDYTLEAKNLDLIGSHLNNSDMWKDIVVVPKPKHELCTKNCLVMDYLQGHKFIHAIKSNFTAIAKV